MKSFIPELNQGYFYIGIYGLILPDFYRGNLEEHKYRIKTGNCYPTIEAARYHRDMEIKSWQIRQFAFEPDWSDQIQLKWRATFNHEKKKMK